MRKRISALRKILRTPRYAAAAGGLAAALFAFLALMKNFSVLRDTAASPAFSFTDWLGLVWDLLRGGIMNLGWLGLLLSAAMSVLFGINIAVLWHLRAENKKLRAKGGAAALGGTIAGILGVGCASCGSILLTSILASFGATGLIALFPLRGQEFAIVSIVLLLISLSGLLKSAALPPGVCAVPPQKTA
ncbi:hypothetical protein D6833_09045 [Candidatus Parcubacteria bacterium]|nr:MAG: hypothetical protein D6833_09045 [Candidatus Parcubacteria bacterium]